MPGLDHPARFDRSSMSIELARQGGGRALESVTFRLRELASLPRDQAFSAM